MRDAGRPRRHGQRGLAVLAGVPSHVRNRSLRRGSSPTRRTGPANTLRGLEEVGRPADDLGLTRSGTVAASKLTSRSQVHAWRTVRRGDHFPVGVAVLVAQEARRPRAWDPVAGGASQVRDPEDRALPGGRPSGLRSAPDDHVGAGGHRAPALDRAPSLNGSGAWSLGSRRQALTCSSTGDQAPPGE